MAFVIILDMYLGMTFSVMGHPMLASEFSEWLQVDVNVYIPAS